MTPDEKAMSIWREAYHAWSSHWVWKSGHWVWKSGTAYQAAAAVIRKASDEVVAERDAEIARLREALQSIADNTANVTRDLDNYGMCILSVNGFARQALGEQQ